jgi:hypothetical protein
MRFEAANARLLEEYRREVESVVQEATALATSSR